MARLGILAVTILDWSRSITDFNYNGATFRILLPFKAAFSLFHRRLGHFACLEGVDQILVWVCLVGSVQLRLALGIGV